jgi:hypothetical protein
MSLDQIDREHLLLLELDPDNLMEIDPDILICPITQELPNIGNLVVASDGFIYDKDALIEALSYSNKSPMTREPITSYIKCYFFNNLLEKHLNGDHLKFKYSNSLCQFTLKPLIHPMLDICGLFYEKEDRECEKNITCHIFNNLIKEYKKHILVMIEKRRYLGLKPIHYICYSTPEMIKYIIDKGADLEYADDGGMISNHQICHYSRPRMISNYQICHYSRPIEINYMIDLKYIEPKSEIFTPKKTTPKKIKSKLPIKIINSKKFQPRNIIKTNSYKKSFR